MTKLTRDEFNDIKALLKLKKNTVLEIANSAGWSERTVYRIREARSFKQYKELCKSR